MDPVYLIVWMDGIVFKVRDNGKIINKTVYLCVGLKQNGLKEVLGMWVGKSESSSFWMGVLTDLKARGVDVYKSQVLFSADGIDMPDALAGLAASAALAVSDIPFGGPISEVRVARIDLSLIHSSSDHLILKEDEFKEAILKGLEFVSNSPQLLTLGIKPNRPETGYGYIQIRCV